MRWAIIFIISSNPLSECVAARVLSGSIGSGRTFVRWFTAPRLVTRNAIRFAANLRQHCRAGRARIGKQESVNTRHYWRARPGRNMWFRIVIYGRQHEKHAVRFISIQKHVRPPPRCKPRGSSRWQVFRGSLLFYYDNNIFAFRPTYQLKNEKFDFRVDRVRERPTWNK